MEKNTDKPRSRKEMEAIRLRAVQAVLRGDSPAAVSREIGCHRSRIYAWLKAYRHDGESGLLAKPVPGRPPKSAVQGTPPDLADLVPLIYRSVLDTSPNTIPWRAFLKKLGAVLNCISADVITNVETPGTPLIGMPDPVPPGTPFSIDGVRRFVEAFERLWPSNPLLRGVNRSGDIALLRDVLPEEEWEENPYYRKVIQSAGRRELMGIGFSGPDNVLCLLQLAGDNQRKPFGEREKRMLRALRPHLEIAMEIFVRVRHSEVAIAALKNTTSHLGIATFVLDGNGYLIQANDSGYAIAAKKYLRLDNKKLVFPSPEFNRQFHELVRRAIAWRLNRQGDNPANVIRAEHTAAANFGVLVQPIVPPHSRMPLSYTAAINPHVIVHIADPAQRQSAPAHHLVAHLFDLPIREAHLATLLASGHDLNEAAAIMKVTVKTARTYLQRVYGKLDINRQTELLQLILKSVVLLA